MNLMANSKIHFRLGIAVHQQALNFLSDGVRQLRGKSNQQQIMEIHKQINFGFFKP